MLLRPTRRLAAALALLTAVATLGMTASGVAASAAPTPTFVQLGDSYSSGNGTGDYTERYCYRSPVNYGAQVADSMGARYVNAACSGGVINDILNPRALGEEQSHTRTYEIDPAMYPDQRAEWERRAREDQICGPTSQPDYYFTFRSTNPVAVGSSYTATAECQLWAEPQIESVNRDTDAVFLTVGGNDLGFSSIVANCLVVRDPSSCRTTLESARARAPQMVERTKDALRAVQQRSGGRAEVYLLSYPFLINTESYGIPEAAPSYDAGAALNELQLFGDLLQAQGISQLNAEPGPDRYHFVDTVKQSWGVHAHGLDPHLVPDNSRSWIVPVAEPGRVQAEWVHPKPPGWVATADALRAEVTSTL